MDNDYKDSPNPLNFNVRVFDGHFSQTKEEAYEKHLKKQTQQNKFMRKTNLPSKAIGKNSSNKISSMNLEIINQSSSRLLK